MAEPRYDGQTLLGRLRDGEHVNMDRWGQARTFGVTALLDGEELVVRWADANRDESGEDRYPATPEGIERLLYDWD